MSAVLWVAFLRARPDPCWNVGSSPATPDSEAKAVSVERSVTAAMSSEAGAHASKELT